MKIFITGANGFIGKNLAEYLRGKYTIFEPSKSGLNLFNERDVSRYFSHNDFDIIIHCAVVGGSRGDEQIKDSLKNNLLMVLNLLKHKKTHTRFINLGSGAEYDKSEPIINVNESYFGTNIPQDDYGLYKFICSRMLENSDNSLNLRLFGIFGKYEDYRYRFISYAICRNILSLPIIINQDVYFDYTSIKDLSRIIEHFIISKGQYKDYNIGSGNRINLVTITEMVNHTSDIKSEIIVRKQGLNREYSCDNSRLMGELKNFKFTPFDKSLQELYNWYKININKIRMDDILKSPK